MAGADRRYKLAAAMLCLRGPRVPSTVDDGTACSAALRNGTAAGSYESSIFSRRWGTRGRESRRREARGSGRRLCCRSGRWRELRGRVGVCSPFLHRVHAGYRPRRTILGAHGAIRVPGVLRLRPAAYPAVPGGSPGL